MCADCQKGAARAEQAEAELAECRTDAYLKQTVLDDSHLVNNWEEEARRYCENADYWRTRAEQAEAELAECRERLAKYEAEPNTEHRKRQQVNREHHAFHHVEDDQFQAELERLRAGIQGTVKAIERNYSMHWVHRDLKRLLEKPE